VSTGPPGPELVEVDGVRLELRRVGAGSAGSPCVVFLHEGLGSAALWRDYPDRLCRELGARGLVYSRRGYGASDPARLPRAVGFMHEEARRFLPRLLEREGVERPVLYGHSDGASIALLHAARRPRAARALVLEAPHTFVEEVTVRSIARLEERYRDTGLSGALGRWHERPDETVLGWTGVWLDPAFRAWDIRGEIASVAAPTLVVQGAEDEYGTWAQVDAVEGGTAGPVESLRLPGCGHAPHRERPEETLAAAAAFLRRALEG